MNDLIQYHPEFNMYPDIIVFDEKNPTIRSPYSPLDLSFYQTRETLNNPDDFRTFIKNAESTFRSSREYKAYKAHLIENIGINRCQILGNISTEDAEIELHHNMPSLFDMCILITMHTINTIGKISTFDLVQLLIQEHYSNNVGVVFLSKTAHQMYTNDPDGFIPPDMMFGKWWELLSKYKLGITYDFAYKVIKYIKKYQDKIPNSINIDQQEQILSYAWMNEYGMPAAECGEIPYMNEIKETEGYKDYGF